MSKELTSETEKRYIEIKANVISDIDFDVLKEIGVTIDKKLTEFDKRVSIAACALYDAGYSAMTVTQICAVMGNSKPNADDIKKTNDSLTKMSMTIAHVKNECPTESLTDLDIGLEEYPEGTIFVTTTEPWLMIERRCEFREDGISQAVVHFITEPPLTNLAKKFKQITTISKRLLVPCLDEEDIELAQDFEEYLRRGYRKEDFNFTICHSN